MKMKLTYLLIAIISLSFALGGCVTGEAKGGKGNPKPQCSDGIDNDGDSFVDFEGLFEGRGKNKVKIADSDPGCTSNEDDDEYNPPICEPTNEICDGEDNDCDGKIDDGLSQQCGITNVGACEYGTQTCNAGEWGSCQGNIDPTNEKCDGVIDDDCDGVVDEGCSCTNGQTTSCGSDIGECQSGTQTCNAGVWGVCIGEIGPTTETCDEKDNDCDGLIDEIGCSPSDFCYDTDSGIDPQTAGSVYGVYNSMNFSYMDICNGTLLLIENLCNGTQPMQRVYDCNISFGGPCLNNSC